MFLAAMLKNVAVRRPTRELARVIHNPTRSRGIRGKSLACASGNRKNGLNFRYLTQLMFMQQVAPTLNMHMVNPGQGHHDPGGARTT